MTTDRTNQDPFSRFLQQARGILGFWGRFVGGSVLVMLVFGVIAPLAVVVFLFTLAVPVLVLVLWGQSLDQELGWTDVEDGP